MAVPLDLEAHAHSQRINGRVPAQEGLSNQAKLRTERKERLAKQRKNVEKVLEQVTPEQLRAICDSTLDEMSICNSHGHLVMNGQHIGVATAKEYLGLVKILAAEMLRILDEQQPPAGG